MDDLVVKLVGKVSKGCGFKFSHLQFGDIRLVLVGLEGG